MHKNITVIEEGVILVTDEQSNPDVVVRKNGCKIEFYKLTPLSFGDTKNFLTDLVGSNYQPKKEDNAN